MTLSLSNQQLSLPARAAAACVNDQLPIIQINDSEHIYKTFVSPIWDGAITDEQVSSIAPAIQAIAEQANALITGNKLGFAGIISPPKYGVFLIFSYPGDERKQESTAKLVAKSIAEESWWLDSNRHVCRFEAKKINAIACATTHFNTYHMKIFRLQDNPATPAYYKSIAQQALDAAVTAEDFDEDECKRQLPMFSNVSDEEFNSLIKSRTLVGILDKYLKATALYCEDSKALKDVAPNCCHRLVPCKKNAHNCHCGRSVSYECTKCGEDFCRVCFTSFLEAMSEDEENELLERMLVPPKPPDTNFEQEEEDIRELLPRMSWRAHPVKFGGNEVRQMQKFSQEQQIQVLECLLPHRGVSLKGNKPEEQFPAFLDVYKENFGHCHKGMRKSDNLLASARKTFDAMVTSATGDEFKLPKRESLEPEIREQVERILHDDKSKTCCRGCKNIYKSVDGSVVCSAKCKSVVRAEAEGMLCHVCARTCTRKQFYEPSTRVWFPTDILESTEDQLDTGFAKQPDIQKFLLETTRI